jgi:hypothetical protein
MISRRPSTLPSTELQPHGQTLINRQARFRIHSSRVAEATRRDGSPEPEASQIRSRLLSGGNPQIAKAHGDAPVRTYIAAMPGWKRAIGRRLDAIIAREVPAVRKAVKWNSPLYGAGGADQGWFLGIHCFDKYIKIAFFRGGSLHPFPPDESRQKHVRYLNIREEWGSKADEAQFADWVSQASRLPGERM